MNDSSFGGASLRRAVSVGVRWTAGQTLGSQLLQFAVFAILARVLSPKEFGIIGIATIFISLTEVFSGTAGLSTGLIQRHKLSEDDKNTAFWLSFLMAVAFALGLVASAGLVGDLFKEPQAVPVLRVMAIIPLLGALGVVPDALLTRALEFKALSIRSLAGIASGGVVGVTMAIAGAGVWAIVGQQVTSRLVGTIALYWAASWRPRFATSRSSTRWLVPFGFSIIGRDIVHVISRRADNFIIGVRLDAAALGVYRVGYRMFLVVTEVFVRTTSKLALPTLSRLQNEPDRLGRAVNSAVRLTALISVPAFIGMAVLSREIVLVFFGPQWTDSASVMAALSVAGVLQTFAFFANSLVLATGHTGLVVRMALLSTVLNVVGFVIAVQWGITAVAVAYSIRVVLVTPIWLHLSNKYASVRPLQVMRQYAMPIASSALMASTIVAARELWMASLGPTAVLAICIPLGVLVYGVSALLTQRSTMNEAMAMLKAGRRATT